MTSENFLRVTIVQCNFLPRVLEQDLTGFNLFLVSFLLRIILPVGMWLCGNNHNHDFHLPQWFIPPLVCTVQSELEIHHHKFKRGSDKDLNSIASVILGYIVAATFCSWFYFDLYVGLNIVSSVCVCCCVSLFYAHQMLWLCKCFSVFSLVSPWAVFVPCEGKKHYKN